MANLDFERPIIELQRKIEELRTFASGRHVDLSSEIKTLEEKLTKLRKDTYANLSAWQRVQIARHPGRPYSLDYIKLITSDFIELHGDRLFGDDKAIICGLAKVSGKKILIIGQQKGRDLKENILRNFGCAHPEGFRKSMRLMKMAACFNLPIVVFIDTPGAYPGIGAEERGQAQAIAYNLREMMLVGVPIVAVVIGEGGSGGALGIGIADKICILENAYYSVISPEGCAAILWKSSGKAAEAAEALKLTAGDLLKAGLVDEVIPEPLGGAHNDPEKTANNIKETLIRYLEELSHIPQEELLEQRYEKFRRVGRIDTEEPS
ncbi:MAG: acetyl-CoA carboxylase carboxyl transferase subunit alpha [Candidatus Omnitrophica bacterium CG11_big_fil_rev_8_21_14_0_20_42_13]|uniref:Acetyl-coenzyme A carboxylase carboxyl transferase subunit alpha n=1 Tax=Candidatus Ghiorseimicrobium undicola TaxID=1974746 RepID=A0A2H0LXK9_9BACT|nr:MAG: acetyl-CoA carboxylase carboxyl transferase subunit alpha [Candidatus Omnitrophica bacterium CG11_big_fil_rev_8_21_14_0_20_42_13]